MIPKFRAWHKELKQWCEPYSFTIEDLMTISFSSIGLTAYEEYCAVSAIYKDIEITQWTGLQDVKGIDIFEGDIISIMEHQDIFSSPVKFSSGCFYLPELAEDYDNIGLCTFLDDSDYEARVIGNIYENPELLEQT